MKSLTGIAYARLNALRQFAAASQRKRKPTKRAIPKGRAKLWGAMERARDLSLLRSFHKVK